MKRQTKKVAAKKPTPAKEVTPFFSGGDIADPSRMQQSMARLGQASRNVGGGLFLRFTKQGEWLFGQDQDDVEEGERFAVNPMSFTNGYIGWENGAVVGEHMCSVMDGMPCSQADLEPITGKGQSDGWSAQLGLSMKSLDEDEPLELRYNATSRGGKQAIGTLADEISARMLEDANSCVPIIELDADSYKHKQYGKIFTPILSVVAWADSNGVVVEEVEDEAA